MKIEQDGPLSWLVESESEPEIPHQVTLFLVPGGKAGAWCSCTDWKCRHEPKVRRGASIRQESCKHIRAVVDEIKWMAVEELVRHFDTGEGRG